MIVRFKRESVCVCVCVFVYMWGNEIILLRERSLVLIEGKYVS